MDDEEQFFVLKDRKPVKPGHATSILKLMVKRLGLDNGNYSMHSFRIGRTSDLIKYKYPLDEVQRLGRWRSNAVLKYIRS